MPPGIAWSPAQPAPGDQVALTATGGPFLPGTSFFWQISGGAVSTASGTEVLTHFSSLGDYTVTLRVAGPAGSGATITRTISVVPPLCSTARPFDLLYGTVDANGLPLNPEWGWQCTYRGSADPSQYPDPHSLCNAFSYNDSHTALNDNDCSNQITGWDVPLFTSIYFNICHWNGSGLDGDDYVHGHVNWMPVTYTGEVTFQDISTGPFQDYDSNFLLYPDNTTAPQLHTPTVAGLSPADAQTQAITLEYYDNEVALAFLGQSTPLSTWMSYARHLQRERAVVIGLMGLDNRHDSGSELHPVFGLAARVWGGPPGADRWLVLFRNTGSEGGCSSHQAFAHRLYTPGNRITLPLPGPLGHITRVELGPHPDLYGFHVASGQSAPISAVLAPDHRAADVTVTLSAPANYPGYATGAFGEPLFSGPILAGTIDLYWSTFHSTRRQNVVPPRPAAPGHPRTTFDSAAPETQLLKLAVLLNPAEQAVYYGRAALASSMHTPASPAAQRAHLCSVLGPAATRAARQHRHLIEVDYVRYVLRCS